MSFPSPSRRALVAAAVLAPVLAGATEPADPVFAAIEACRQTDRDFLALVDGLGSDPTPEAERHADEAGAVNDAVNKALGDVHPTTVAGLHALIRFYAGEVEHHESGTLGAWALNRLVAAIDGGTL